MSEYKLEDGRSAIKLENQLDSNTKVTEIYVEPKLEKKLTQRVIEKLGVVERIVENIDETTGEVVSRIVEGVCRETESLEKIKSPMQIIVEKKLNSIFDFKYYLFVLILVVQALVLGYVVFLM
jgi:hypothetical protein